MNDSSLAALLSVTPLVLTFLPAGTVVLCVATLINSFDHDEGMAGVVAGVLTAAVGILLFGAWVHSGHIPTEKALALGAALAGLLLFASLRRKFARGVASARPPRRAVSGSRCPRLACCFRSSSRRIEVSEIVICRQFQH